jgi:hypothetical protein
MTWAFKRKLFYSAILIAIVFAFGFFQIYPYFNKAPTCTDGKKNGTETGVDCGGSCPRACLSQVDQLSILWSRVFQVVPGRFNAVAYLENHNENTAIYKIKYKFYFADKDNIYIGKREGETYVPPKGKFAVFEPAIDVGKSIPVYTRFEFTEVPNWVQVSKNQVSQLKIAVSDIKLENQNTEPRLTATVKNTSLYRIPEVSFIAILYDAMGNVVTASHTYLDMLVGEESTDISFTWREPITSQIVAKEIIPIFNIFLVKLN